MRSQAYVAACVLVSRYVTCKSHKELLEEGKELKQEAVKAMSGEASVDTTPQKVTEWLDKIKKQTKVVTTILKGK